jgi:hypothetical protein
MPEYASAAALPLIGSARLIDRGPFETDASYVSRLIQAIPTWKLAGTPLGLLLALYYAGYTSAVLVQQNGRWYTLSTPIDPANPTASLVQGDGPALIAPFTSHVNPSATPIPAGEPWYTFDGDIEHCSRFAVLLPTQPSTWRHQGRAVFAGSSSAIVTWSQPFASSTYDVLLGFPESTEFFPAADDPTSKTTTQVTVRASDEVTGTVAALAWANGENPYCCPSASTLASLRRLINLWRPAKALCIGIFAVVTGRVFDYPPTTFGGMETLDPPESVVVQLAA